jgi:hypothetical protein
MGHPLAARTFGVVWWDLGGLAPFVGPSLSFSQTQVEQKLM